MRPEMERPDALAGATDAVEGQLLPVGTAENGPDAPKAKSTSVGCTPHPRLPTSPRASTKRMTGQVRPLKAQSRPRWRRAAC